MSSYIGHVNKPLGSALKDLLKEISTNLNIVKLTNRPKLLDRLEELHRQLNVCEKALSDYLETKRLAYPRFYFISSADLLHILSNGKYVFRAFRYAPTKFYIGAFDRNRQQSGGGLQAPVQAVRLVGESHVENGRGKSDEARQRDDRQGRRRNGHARDVRLRRKGVASRHFVISRRKHEGYA